MSYLWLATDVASAGALLLAGIFGVRTWQRCRAGRGAAYWLLAGLGMLYLAVDERFSLHERIGRWLENDAALPRPPLVNHHDDLVLAAFALAGLALTSVHAPELLRHPPVTRLLIAGGGLLAAAIAIDSLAPVDGWAPNTEEPLELVGCLLLLAAFRLRWLCAVEPGRDLRATGQAARNAGRALPG